MSAERPRASPKPPPRKSGPPPSRQSESPLASPSEAAAELAAAVNLGPKSAQVLVAAGVSSFAELRRLGSIVAYAKAKQHEPKVTLNLLWALEGALSSLPWQTVAKEHRTSLLLALEQYQMTANPSVKGTCLRQAPYVER
jgi:DNA transformation protein and related proteins